MLSIRSKEEEVREKTTLLREVTELLMWELTTISERHWENLPELKHKKALMAERLQKYDWTPGPEAHESLDVLMLKSQISDLEYQSRQKVMMQMKIIRQQLDLLQEKKRGWLECVSGYLAQSREMTTSL